MKERPILFSTPMVQAILEGRKTQTRRIKFKCDVGDVLWVRESFTLVCEREVCIYKADESLEHPNPFYRWKPSIFMLRRDCRLFLRVKAVRVERLHCITEHGIKAEGVCIGNFPSARHSFRQLWNDLNHKRGHTWESNPIVKVIEFEPIQNYGGKV